MTGEPPITTVTGGSHGMTVVYDHALTLADDYDSAQRGAQPPRAPGEARDGRDALCGSSAHFPPRSSSEIFVKTPCGPKISLPRCSG